MIITFKYLSNGVGGPERAQTFGAIQEMTGWIMENKPPSPSELTYQGERVDKVCIQMLEPGCPDERDLAAYEHYEEFNTLALAIDYLCFRARQGYKLMSLNAWKVEWTEIS